jgi:hypothetical protein
LLQCPCRLCRRHEYESLKTGSKPLELARTICRNALMRSSGRSPRRSAAEASVSSCGAKLEELLRAGYDLEDATEVAFHLEIDLHQASDLVRRGCPSATAARIMA